MRFIFTSGPELPIVIPKPADYNAQVSHKLAAELPASTQLDLFSMSGL
jgi:hypothetical protein